MKRRAFIAGLGGAAAWPMVAHAQGSTKRPLITVLSAITREDNAPLRAFVRGMRELGYVDGQNIDIEYRFAEGRLDRFPVLAEELLRLSPNVIVAFVTPAAVAVRALTQRSQLFARCLPMQFAWLDCERGATGRERDRRIISDRGAHWRAIGARAPIIPDVVKIEFLVNVVASDVVIDRQELENTCRRLELRGSGRGSRAERSRCSLSSVGK